MTPEEISKIKVMGSTAGIYLHSADTLGTVCEQSAKNTKNEIVRNQFLADLTSTFLLYSLSAEISLKVILKCEGKTNERAHDLQGLYSQLDTEHKEELKINVNNKEFDKLLVDHKDNFVSWRYFYEGNANAIKVPFLKRFSKEAFRLARKLVLQLKSTSSN